MLLMHFHPLCHGEVFTMSASVLLRVSYSLCSILAHVTDKL